MAEEDRDEEGTTRAMVRGMTLEETGEGKRGTTTMRTRARDDAMDARAGAREEWGGRVVFRTKYWTNWGENVVVCGPAEALGGWNPERGVRMSCAHVGERRQGSGCPHPRLHAAGRCGPARRQVSDGPRVPEHRVADYLTRVGELRFRF